MKKIKVGVIGLGFIGKQHIEALRRLPYIEIVAAADVNSDMKEWCEKNYIPYFYDDFSRMLSEQKLEVVHDCTPNYFHYKVNQMILNAGCHVYSEKPLTIRSVEGKELAALAEKRGLLTAVNFNYRNNLMVQEIYKRIKNGKLGTMSHLQVEYLQDWLLYDTDFDWRIQKEKGGESRAVADIGSHCFDTVQFVTGEKIVSVYARFHRQYKKRVFFGQFDTFSTEKREKGREKKIDVENEDAAIILFRLESGMIGSINVTQVCAGKKNGLKILISGTRESYEWAQECPDKLWIGHRDSGNETLYAGSKNLTEEISCYADLPDGHPVGWKDALVNGFDIFYKNLKKEKCCMKSPDFLTGYYITKIVEACIKSNLMNCWIDVEQKTD